MYPYDSQIGAEINMHKIQQTIKWTVYALLIVNFVFYVFEDWNRAMFTLNASSSALKWAGEFATTIDELGWFLLLAMFEIETYIVDDEDWTGWIAHTVRGVRMFCYALIAHTVYAFTIVVIGLQPTVPVEDVASLCDMVGADVSYVYNLEYTDVNEQTCGELSNELQLFWLADDPIVTDMAGLSLERDLAWADLAEVILWLLILLAIEVIVRLQSHGVTGSTFISTLNAIKYALYASLIGLGIYWASLGHWLYLWDELVWIGGFAAIEMNVSQWRDELLEEKDSSSSLADA
ncbi:MAG: hypothetical protein IIA12_05545 [Proteobacteria bacterium]|nr:hypothetical protein [Pseudomonadota bacterium]